MGKGGYLGGSTIIYANGHWKGSRLGDGFAASHRPRPKPPVHVSKQAVEQAQKRDTARVSFLHRVLDAALVDVKKLPTPPTKYADSIGKNVEAAGGVLNWAKQQPEFTQFLEKKRKKQKKRQEKTGIGGLPHPGMHKQKRIKDDADRLERLVLLQKKAICEKELSRISIRLAELDRGLSGE